MAAAEKKDSPAVEALRREALREDDLARASKEGYPVALAMLDLYSKRLIARVGQILDAGSFAGQILDAGSFAARPTRSAFQRGCLEERSAPGAREFALYDAVLKAARLENETIPIVVGKWDVSRILETDVCDSERHKHIAPTVLATLTVEDVTEGRGYVEREVEFTTEDFSCPKCRDDE